MDKKVTEVSFDKDDLLGSLTHIKRQKEAIKSFSYEIAEIRRAVYEKYLEIGFSPAEALELCKRPIGEL